MKNDTYRDQWSYDTFIVLLKKKRKTIILPREPAVESLLWAEICGFCNMVYSSKTYIKLKYGEILFAHNIQLICPIIS